MTVVDDSPAPDPRESNRTDWNPVLRGEFAKPYWSELRRFVAEERHAYGSARLQRVIAVSHGTARELREFYGVAEDRITVVPNGVDRAVFKPAEDGRHKRALRQQLGLPADEFLALFVGGDWERKGVRDAMAAIAGVLVELLDVNGVPVLDGDGNWVDSTSIESDTEKAIATYQVEITKTSQGATVRRVPVTTVDTTPSAE